MDRAAAKNFFAKIGPKQKKHACFAQRMLHPHNILNANLPWATMKNLDASGRDTSDPYNRLIGATVVDRNGAKASIRALRREGDATIAVLATEDGRMIDADLSEFERHDGSFFTPVVLERRTHGQEQALPAHSPPHGLVEETRIPVAQEEIHVDKRRVDTGRGIRVDKHVLEHEEIVDVPHVEEKLSVRHVEVGEIISSDKLPQARQEGDTYIIPVFEEIYVLEKRIRLKEEVHITRERKETREAQKVRLRSEKVAVERFDEGEPRE